jgi:hypothetical protein
VTEKQVPFTIEHQPTAKMHLGVGRMLGNKQLLHPHQTGAVQFGAGKSGGGFAAQVFRIGKVQPAILGKIGRRR